MIKKFIKVNHVTTLHGIKKNTNPYKKANKVIAVSVQLKSHLILKAKLLKIGGHQTYLIILIIKKNMH